VLKLTKARGMFNFTAALHVKVGCYKILKKIILLFPVTTSEFRDQLVF